MRIVLQRVAWARVHVDGEEAAAIGPGLLALVGAARGDTVADAERLAAKTVRLRLFDGPERPFDVPLAGLPGGALLCVSQFTLLGSVRRGNRPSWSDAAPGGEAEPLVDAYAAAVAAHGVAVAMGRFGAHMDVSLLNDGPVTLVLDGADMAGPRRRGTVGPAPAA